MKGFVTVFFPWFFSSLLVVSLPCMANIEISSEVRDVYLRGECEQAGKVSISITGDDFSNASEENPIYLEIKLAQDIFLAHNRVTQVSPYSLIDLALYLQTDDPNLSMVAPQDAISIVRWVRDESSIWIRVNHSSDQWISDGANSFGPSSESPVLFEIGVSWVDPAPYEEPYRNLPFNNYQESGTTTGASTQLCLNLSQAQFPSTGDSPLVTYEVGIYGADAEVSPGVYQPGSPLALSVSGDLTMARAKERALDITVLNTNPVLSGITRSDQMLKVDGILDLRLNTPEIANILQLNLTSGSVFHLEIDELNNYGFAKGDIVVDYPVKISYDKEFIVNDESLYRLASITWLGAEQDLVDFPLPIQTRVRVPKGSNAQEIFISPSLDLRLQSGCGFGNYEVQSSERWEMAMITDRFLPHITQSENFSSQLLITNPTPGTQDYRVDLLSNSGLVNHTLSGQIGAFATERLSLDGLSSALAYARIDRETKVMVSIEYLATGNNKSPAQVHETSRAARNWRLYGGDPAVTFDGVAILNAGNSATTLTLTQMDEKGRIIDTHIEADINGRARKLMILSQVFEAVPGSFYQIKADQPLIITALRGDAASDYLWENAPLAID